MSKDKNQLILLEQILDSKIEALPTYQHSKDLVASI